MGCGSSAARSRCNEGTTQARFVQPCATEVDDLKVYAGGAGANGGPISLPSTATVSAADSTTECSPSGHYVWDILPGQRDGATPATGMSTDARVQRLEDLVHTQAAQLEQMRQTLGCVRRDARCTVSVLQYNILASYLGRNTQPWFLYGADISNDVRENIFNRYYERDANGAPKHQWPEYVEGILTPDEIANVELRDRDFRWEDRKEKLAMQIRSFDADVISLVEDDQHIYFSQTLADSWDSVFHKRPRTASLDGCGVFWRRSKFDLVAWEGMDFVDGNDKHGRETRDRSCLIVLLRWRGATQNLVVMSTHLAKDPDNRSQTAIRVRQVSQLVEGLTEFTAIHEASDAPVILLGDLNARHFGEIRGITRTVWQIKGSRIHKFLWRASDVPTGPTSVTKARQCRIDCVQFLSSQLEVLEVSEIPVMPMGEVIPSWLHPSDHFPVHVKFMLKDSWQKHKEYARAWLECVAGREKLHPLTEQELRIAFDFFDRDRTSLIDAYNMEEACLDLHCNFHVDVQKLLLDCFPNGSISYDNFIRAYEVRLNHERMRCIGDLECAFQFFAGDKTGTINLETLEGVFREITPVSFSDGEVKEMIARLNIGEGQTSVDLRSFCEIVCRATFPHRDRRRMSSKALHDEAGNLPPERQTTSESVPKPQIRSVTKDIRQNLNRLNDMLLGSADASPHHSPTFVTAKTATPREMILKGSS